MRLEILVAKFVLEQKRKSNSLQLDFSHVHLVFEMKLCEDRTNNYTDSGSLGRRFKEPVNGNSQDTNLISKI